MMDNVPYAIWEGEFDLFGVKVRCAVLNDGRRVLNAEDMELLFESMDKDREPDENEVLRFAGWCKGIKAAK